MDAVRDRLLRATACLNRHSVPYAVTGGNAVAAWVARVDQSAVRNAQDVNLILRRDDFERATAALATAGFVFRHVAGIDLFLDGPAAKPRDAVHVLFASEFVRPEYLLPAADPGECDSTGEFRVLNLEALVRMKLTSFRRKDQVHLLDLMEVGLVDASWLDRVEPLLRPRLQELIDNPD